VFVNLFVKLQAVIYKMSKNLYAQAAGALIVNSGAPSKQIYGKPVHEQHDDVDDFMNDDYTLVKKG
jgi:hypothetical protein